MEDVTMKTISAAAYEKRLLKDADNITIRFNHGRMIAAFDSQADMDRWLKSYANDFYQVFMYTIHMVGQILDLEKYIGKMENA
jgi:hypothetical protein